MKNIQKRLINLRCYEKSEKRKAGQRKYRRKNLEKIKEKNKQWRLDNPEKFKRNVLKSPNRVLSAYRTSAKKRGHIFSLTKEEFWKLIKGECFYCGKSSNKRNGIDRKDNNIGYVIENCVTACRKCNIMKGQMTYEEFIERCIKIANKKSSIIN